MSGDFEWGIKNGDLEKVKEAVEKVWLSLVAIAKIFQSGI